MTAQEPSPQRASPHPWRPDETVLIVGGGPTGLTLANLLGQAGVRVVVAERRDQISQEPRAVSFDDESMRTLQACDLDEAAYRLVLRGTGTKYFGADGRALAYARGPAHPPLGHPVKNPFSQPRFEQVLRDGLNRFTQVDVRMSAELVDLAQDGEAPVLATLRKPDGSTEKLSARVVIGCDGGRSTVRTLSGIAMRGSSFEQPWLVIDTTADWHDQRYAMHHGDPRRPFVIVAGRDGRCRYEFMLLPGEDATQMTQLPAVRALLAPFRPIQEEEIERAAVYTFHALIAERWRVGSVLLAGDAAHMMPPFAGQGLNSGLRDAANLAWKIAAVVGGKAEPSLLDSYEAERRPHAEATVKFSVTLGRFMMSRSPVVALLRDRLIRLGSRIPAVDRYVSENRFKPTARYPHGAVLPEASGKAGVVGRMLPQPMIMRASGAVARLDEVLGPGFALLAVSPAEQLLPPRSPLWSALGVRLLEVLLDDRAPRCHDRQHETIADVDGSLTRFLGGVRGQVLLVRPDRFVAAVLPLDVDVAAPAIGRMLAMSGSAKDSLRPVGKGGDAEPAGAPTVAGEDR